MNDVVRPLPEGRLRRWSRRLRVQVTLAAAGVTVLAALGGAVVFLGALDQNLEDSLVEGAQQQASAVAARLAEGADPAAAVASGKDDVVVQVLAADGRILATDHPDVTSPLAGTVGTATEVDVPVLDDSFAVAAVAGGDGRLAVVGVAEEGRRRALQVALELLAIGVPLAVLLVGVVVWTAVGRALRPVEQMRREAAAITSEHLHRRLPELPGDDEIPRLAVTLNEMLDGIDAGQRRQRQFVSDASHELRSPLAVIRQLVEVAQRQPGATSVETLAAQVLREETRMEELVAALLALARLDAGTLGATLAVDVDDLVHAEVERLRPLTPSIVIDRSAVGAGQVRGDAVLLGQVVANLLANAARHATHTVRVSLAEADGAVRLAVEDDGPGIDAADRERVFERFVRLDEARTRDAGGSGLGLAIVRDVVTAHGGHAHVETAALGGARFVVDLPATDQD